MSVIGADRRSFILRHTRLLPVPHAPELSLHVAEEATELWQKTEDELATIGLPPPFWAFAWAGGQALARYLLDHPDLVAGKTVLVAAHGNSLRALVKHLDEISDDDIAALNIPTGIPLYYELDDDFQPLVRGGRYLDPEAAEAGQKAVANQGKK